MKSSLIRLLILGVFAFPLVVAGQQAPIARPETPEYWDAGHTFSSNVPINELSPRAFRRFHRRFEAAGPGECWFKSADGYQVSFRLGGSHEFAYFGLDGGFKCSVKYYQGSEVPADPGDVVKRRFPGYRIGVVTEVNDGQKIFYTVQILNPLFVKALTVCDGRIEVTNELNNGGAGAGPAEASR